MKPTACRRTHRGEVLPLPLGGFLAVALGVGGQDGIGVKPFLAVAEACL
jgi:hypothetical protein